MVLRELIQTFRNLAYVHQEIEGFYTGLAEQHNDTMIQYPALRVSFPYDSLSSSDDDVLSYTFDLSLTCNTVDIDVSNTSTPSEYELNINHSTEDDTLNEIDSDIVLETHLREKALRILAQYIQGLRTIEDTHNYFILQDGWNITSLERYANDVVTGVSVRITISVANDYKCQSLYNLDNTIWNPNNNLLLQLPNNMSPQQVCGLLPESCAETLALIASGGFRGCLISDLNFSDSLQPDYTDLNVVQTTDLEAILCPTIVPKLQYSTLFNGVNKSIVNTVNAPATLFTATQPFTISAWVRFDDIRFTMAIAGRRIAGFLGWLFYMKDSKLHMDMRGTGIIQRAQTAVSMVDNTWYNVGVTYDGSGTAAGIRFFVNGILVPSVTNIAGTLTVIPTTGSLTLGQSLGNFFRGLMSTIRIWSGVMSDADFVLEYNGGTMNENQVNAANIVFEWKGGQDSLFSTNWRYPDGTGISVNPTTIGVNQIYSDVSNIIP